ncbi:MAG: hypothetical protein GX164_06425 [Clostridiales bacterium]|jgi:DNA-binding Lrp family transcriptional regulator|nr:hypothetical protein [Clostridiales bacterium]
MRAFKDIPVPVIVLCFVFGAWPIAVILIILRVLGSNASSGSGSKEKQERNNNIYSYGKNTGSTSTYTTIYKNKSDAGSSTSFNNASSASPQGEARHVPYTRGKFVQLGKYKRGAGTVLSTLFLAIGVFVTFVMALGSFGSAVTTGLTWATFSQVSSTAISATITGILYLFRSYYKSQDYRIISILSILRTRNYISIAELAGMLDVSEKRVIRDLRLMLSKGLLGKQAIIDMRIRYLILTEDAHDDAEQDAIKNGFVGGTFERRREDAAPSQSEAASSEDEFDKILKEIRQRDEEIQNEEVSAKIVKIEAITRNIFKFVEEKPEHKTQIRGFLNYYLPTTLKLLNSYAYFERQGIEGENIRAGKKNIEEILDMLIKGYEHQLDRLFEADTLSVESDISVLEQMLRRDGFYDDDFCIGKDNPFEVNNFSDKGYTDDISDSIGGGTAVAKQHEEEHKDE